MESISHGESLNRQNRPTREHLNISVGRRFYNLLENSRFLARLHSCQPDFGVVLQMLQVIRQGFGGVVAGHIGEPLHFIRKRNFDDQHLQIVTGIQYRP